MNGTQKPLISILLATYEPRLDWLRELLLSLNGQTYPHLCLAVRDDGSSPASFEAVSRLIAETVTAFPCSISRNEGNLGSNRTFALLTEAAQGAYLAYCDQDDVWMPEKLTVLQEVLEREGAGLACSDVVPTDEDGRPVASSITALRPRHVFRSGQGLAGGIANHNYVIGCTMLIRTEIAQASLPFPAHMVHDHYLAFYCAREHGIAVADRPLVYYRRHAGNQTGVLSNVRTREDYRELYVRAYCRRIEELEARFPGVVSEETVRWARAREAHIDHKPGSARALFCLRRYNRAAAWFDLVGLRLPEPMFRWAVELIRRGKL